MLTDSSESLIGGKALRLTQMMDSGFPVKPFVILSVSEIDAIRQIKSVAAALLGRVKSLNVRSGFAVRSSAVGEDGILSWAGQFKSILFVQIEQVEDAILECVDALDSDSVKAYEVAHGTKIGGLALVVQEMVDAQIAGVLFTKDPVEKQKEVMVIEAINGTAEQLVSGRQEPVRYYVSEKSFQIIHQEGSASVYLSLAQIEELVTQAARLRDLFGAEQDIEWAIDSQGKIFINQSRSITVQYVLTTDALKDKKISDLAHSLGSEQNRLASLGLVIEGDVLSDQNIAELITPHPCRMAFGLFTLLFAHGNGAVRQGRNSMGYDIGPELDEGFFRLVMGQPRCSVVHDALTYRVQGIPLADYSRIVMHYLGRIKKDPQLGNYPEVVLYDQDPSQTFLADLFGNDKAVQYRRAYEMFFARMRGFENTLDTHVRHQFFPFWRNMMCQLSETLIYHDDIEGLVGLYHKVTELLRTEACRTFVLSARLGFFAFARLRNRLAHHFSQESDQYLNVLTSGIPVESNPNLSLSIRLFQFRHGHASLEQVIKEFGHLALHELEISVPRYRDRSNLFEQLADRIKDDPLASLAESASAAEDLRSRLICEIGGEQSATLNRDIGLARTFLALREVVKFEYLKGYDLLRQIAVRISRKLGWDDNLIFHLDPREIVTLDQKPMGEMARERRKEHRDLSSIYVPPIIFSNDLSQIGNLPAVEGKILRGIGVTNAIAEGEIVVVHDLNEEAVFTHLRPGSVLVTVTTDPAWSPVLSVIGKSGGLITEIGGLLAHGAIYAREIGFAAVLNVPGATSILKTGMRVRVVGPKGYVEILD